MKAIYTFLHFNSDLAAPAMSGFSKAAEQQITFVLLKAMMEPFTNPVSIGPPACHIQLVATINVSVNSEKPVDRLLCPAFANSRNSMQGSEPNEGNLLCLSVKSNGDCGEIRTSTSYQESLPET